MPADAYYGVQTQRAVENFPISGLTAPAGARHRHGADQEGGARRPTPRSAGSTPTSPTPSSRAADEILGRRAPRSVRRRRLPGRRRHLAQHERQRGARQPRRRDPRRAARRRTSACIPNDHVNMGQSTNDVFPTATRLAILLRAAGPAGSGARARRRAGREERGVRQRAEDRPHAPAGRGADHARPGVRRLRGQRRARGRRSSSDAAEQLLRAEPRRDGASAPG